MPESRPSIKKWLPAVLLAAALVLLGVAWLGGVSPHNPEAVSRRVGRVLEKRLHQLDRYVEDALEEDYVPRLDGIPEDMVIYRYLDDSLEVWYNQFPIFNDDITSRVSVERLSTSRESIVSPFVSLGEVYSFVNYGSKWYVARMEQYERVTVVAGLELENDLAEGYFHGISSFLKAGEKCSVRPLSESVGYPVSVEGRPLFNLSFEHASDHVRRTSPYLWLSALLLIFAVLFFLANKPDWTRFIIAILALTALLVSLYLYGKSLSGSYLIFSPILYADGSLLYSLAALLLTNLLITLLAVCFALKGGWKGAGTIAGALTAIVLIIIYIHFTFKSLVMNSSISMEIFKTATLSKFTPLVYGSYFLLSLTLPLILRSFIPGVSSRGGRWAFAMVTAAYFVLVSSILGFNKEKNRVEVWSNRLAMDRDIALELNLRSIDPFIQEDSRLALLSAQPGSNLKIQEIITETYMPRLAQENDIAVYLLNDENTRGIQAIFDRRVRNGTPIFDNSHFFYSRDNNGRARYTGFFSYYLEDAGSVGLMICVESKANREDRGYLSLLGITEPGRVLLPRLYSYAKYVSGRLVTYKGNYAYPTLISRRDEWWVSQSGRTVSKDGFVHFPRTISEDEIIIVSRPKFDFFNYLVEGVIFALILFLLVTVVFFRPETKVKIQKSYYRNRINAVIFVSLMLTLVGMSVFSVYFVYRRNEANLRDIMTSKVNSIQSVVYARCRNAKDFKELRSQEMFSALENIGASLKSDITLYSPSGKAFMTTTSEIFERMIVGPRLDMNVLRSIVFEHKRFVISKEHLGTHRYYSLYAPVFNTDGVMVAILGSPYTEENYELEGEVLTHISIILVVFFLLLLLVRFLSTRVINRMFRPLSEMSSKMEAADLDHLEYIDYDQDDEISTLVKAYNRMVQDLADSSRAMAQAERDKAWSSMARQVAHEIKNPLTPIKLQLQILIRMKASGNPAWVDKFDEAARIVLGHIDILADTANEFSTFAKLYSEEPVPIALDDLLREEVEMFSSREDIEFTYFGLEGAVIQGPKPQLTRVIVNLLTNAVQAIDQKQEDRPDWKGKVYVSLRNSVRDGFYDIVFDDNGPGVAEENLDKLFTPNFTTKSRGSGLGLAICRNIIERCGGEISYSRSFVLNGACFTVRYPK